MRLNHAFHAIILLTVFCFSANYSVAQCSGGLVPVEVNIENTASGAGTPSFTVFNDQNVQVMTGGPGTTTACLPEGCYTITVQHLNCNGTFMGVLPICDHYSVAGNGAFLDGGMASSGCAIPGTCSNQTLSDEFCIITGCTNSQYCNYNPDATVEDESCFGSFGCLDPAACNYQPWAECSSGLCCYGNDCFEFTLIDPNGEPLTGGAYYISGPASAYMTGGPESSTWTDHLCMTPGCYYIQAVSGIGDPLEIELGDLNGGQINEISEDGSFVSFTYGGISGCDNPQACNYIPESICNDGTCTFPGCTNPQACNYDPLAGCNDGSCILSQGAQVSFHGSTCHLKITDASSNILYEEDISSGGFFTQDQLYQTCLPFECLTFQVTGLTCGTLFNMIPFCETLEIVVNGNQVYYFEAGDGISETQVICITQGCLDPTACNYDVDASVDDGSCSHITGCTDPSMLNYNPEAMCDDGSCSSTLLGCTNPVSCNYDPAALQDDGSCDSNTPVSIHIVNTNTGAANSIVVQFTNELGLLYEATVPVGSSLTGEACLPVGCFSYNVSGKGSGDIVNISTNTMSFDLISGSAYLCLVGGCTDPAYCNYHPYANIDDGSCCNNGHCVSIAFLESGSETLNGLHYNIYNNGILVDTGISFSVDEWYANHCLEDGCYTIEIIPNGAGNPVEWSIDAAGSGLQFGSGAGNFEFSVGGTYGCSDPMACNYDPDVICDDGSCYFGSPMRLNVVNSLVSPAVINYSFSYTYNGPSLVSGTLVAQAGTYQVDLCIPEDCLFFNISGLGTGDSWQLGVIQNGNVFVPLQGFQSSGTNNLANQTICNLYGCTDNGACNYNGYASVDDGSCLYFCDVCVTLELYDQGDETLTGTEINVYNAYMQLTQHATSYQLDEDYIGICLEEAGCYFLEIISSGTPGNPISWIMNMDGNIFSGTGPGLYAITPNGTIGCTDEQAANYDSDASCDDGSCIFPGCTNPEACNFDPLANQDNGTCQMGVHAILGFYNSPISNQLVSFSISNALGQTLLLGNLPLGGTEVSICLPYECSTIIFSGIGEGDTFSITVDANGYLLTEGAYDGNNVQYVELCIDDQGCDDVNACNYNPLAIINDGSCSYLSWEVELDSDNADEVQYALLNSAGEVLSTGILANVQNYLDNYCLQAGCYEFVFVDGDGTTGPGDNFMVRVNGLILVQSSIGVAGTYSFCITTGCTDPNACNYDPQAFYNDGTCIEQNNSCNDPLACNYFPWPACHEYCIYSPNATFTLVNGSTANVISYIIRDEFQNVVLEGNSTTSQVIPLCLAPGCYTVNVSGMQITSPVIVDFWELEVDGQVVSQGQGNSPNNDFCLYDGCTDPESCNYVPGALFDDGSCDDSMGIVVVFEYSGNTDAFPPFYQIVFPGDLDGNFSTGFEITNQSAGTLINYFCVQVACFNFIGAFLEPGDHISVFDFEGNLLLEISGTTATATYAFCPGMGCTDPLACNYDPLAIEDDHSCLYGTSGCTDAAACNYDPAAVCNDQSCVYPGCNDTLACNFNPDAGCNDGSCLLNATLHIVNVNNPVVTFTISDALFNLYFNGNSIPNTINSYFNGCIPFGCLSVSVAGLSGNDHWELIVGTAVVASGNTNGVFNICLHDGCIDLNACNYDPSAVHDDGSCYYGLGCTNPVACNFNPSAVCDDGSCDVLNADFDGNGVINTSDLLLFMSFFGCNNSCSSYDLDQNGVVNTSDLLLMMAEFGDSCF